MYKEILPLVDVDIIVAVFLIVILVMYKRKFNMQDKVNKIYSYIIITVLIILVLEVMDKFILVNSSNYLIPLTKIVNMVGFALSPVVPYIFMEYLFERFKVHIDLRYCRILVFLNIVISMFSYKYNLIFSVGNNNIYQRGPIFFIPMAITYTLFIISFAIVFKMKNDLHKREYKLLLLSQVIPIITATIQIIFNNLLLIWGSVGVVIIAHYIYMQENLIKFDSLTGSWSRRSIENYFNNNILTKNRSFSMIYVDVNDFKEINDNYGHNEGDIALINISNLLQKVFYRAGQVARMGGDEFIIISEISDEVKLKSIVNKIYIELDKVNSKELKPYKLTISLGYRNFENNYLDLNQCIQEVDELMYKDKAKKKNFS